MIDFLAVSAGFVFGCIVICWDANMRKRTYEIRIKEVKEELTQSKSSTEPSYTSKKP